MVDVSSSQSRTSLYSEGSKPLNHRGPLLLAAILSVAGGIYMLAGSVTVVPFISDERRREPIRKMWAALSRDLPDIGHPGIEKVGFWIVVALTALLSVAVMLVAATVTDAPESEADSTA